MQVEHPSRPQSFFFCDALLPTGWAKNVRVKVSGGKIHSVQTGRTAHSDDEMHACVLPGMPNLHSHAFQRAMAGLAECRGPSHDSFWTWRDIMYRFLDQMTPDDVRTIASLAYMEMLESGYTRVGEFHYLHHDRDGTPYADIAEMGGAIAAAAANTGIGLTLLPVLYTYSGFGAMPANSGQRRFLNDMDRYARLIEASRIALSDLGDGVIGIAPHSLRAVSPEQLDALGALGSDGPIHIHIAEQIKEVEDCISWSRQRPVEWLLHHADVDDRWCLVHATHMTETETAALARSGAIAGLCPITEANLGDGLFPATQYIAAGGLYGIGSDSNVLIDMAEELRLLEYGQRLFGRGRNMLTHEEGQSTGGAIFRAALSGSAALGVNSGIAAALSADFFSLDVDHPSLVGKNGDELLDSFLFACGKNAIDCVWRFGKKLVIGGRHVRRDAILRSYAPVLRRLIA
tara:strand:+ start:20533 stop:21909 length:1377 start_codon:yes stop_codon:yes gene_type:complete